MGSLEHFSLVYDTALQFGTIALLRRGAAGMRLVAILSSTTAGIYWFEYAVSSGCAVPVAGAAFASATKR